MDLLNQNTEEKYIVINWKFKEWLIWNQYMTPFPNKT